MNTCALLEGDILARDLSRVSEASTRRLPQSDFSHVIAVVGWTHAKAFEYSARCASTHRREIKCREGRCNSPLNKHVTWEAHPTTPSVQQ